MATDGNEDSFLKSRAFRECAAVFIAVGLVGMVMLAMVVRPRQRASRIGCENNVKQVGLGFRMFASENDDKFPMQFSTNQGGTKEWRGSKEVYRHFLLASNDIGTPKVLICPNDEGRSYNPTQSFAFVRNQNLSYLIEQNAQEAHSSTMMIGDRHLTLNGKRLPNGCYLVSTQHALGWGTKPHKWGGNVGLTDGSCQQVTVADLATLRAQQQIATNWLAIP